MSRWITVANRLPFSLSADKRRITPSSGGLVSALSGVKTKGERIWLGCAPDHLNQHDWRHDWRHDGPNIRSGLKSNSNWTYQPVFPSKTLYDSYYNGFCNDVLWPLLHYQSELVKFRTDTWNAYREMNQLVAREIAGVAKEDDLVWIHDFHFFLLPKMLRELRPELRIGFFLHVPFPSSEIFRELPVRDQILDSLLASNLVGFHDYAYLRHFTISCLRLLGLETEFLSIKREGHTTKLGVFPVSIDTDLFVRRSRDPKVLGLTKEMSRPYFMFLGVDRLDYMKGLDLKLMAFRNLLKQCPQYREKVGLLQVAVPTRAGVPVYNRLARETARLVGEINGEFSTPTWTPVQYLHSSVSHDQLIALYKSTDALLVTSKRDGMNVVVYEYIASQDDERPGVVLLTEFAGALSTLSHTLSINPWDLDDTARKMQIAMEMPKQEKLDRLNTMKDYITNYTATDWAESFISDLEKQVVETSKGPLPARLDATALDAICDRVIGLRPKKVVLFLDYDGTIVPIQPSPELATLAPESKQRIRNLCGYPWLEIVVISGRDSRFLGQQFDGLPLRLVAEHGAKSFDPITRRWKRRVYQDRSSWYPTALKIVTDYTSRVPQSFLEKKHFSIAWHYRKSPNDYAELQARKLAEELETGLANLPVNILRGKKVIEVRAIEANKGVYVNAHLEESFPESVALVIGDDRTDEDMFSALRNRGVSFKVGLESSSADYSIRSQAEVLETIERLCAKLDPHLRASVLQKTGSSSDPDLEIGLTAPTLEVLLSEDRARSGSSLVEPSSGCGAKSDE